MAYKQPKGLGLTGAKTGAGIPSALTMEGSPAYQDERSGSKESKKEAQEQIDKIVDTTGKSPSVTGSARPTDVPYALHAKYDYHAKQGTTDKFLADMRKNK